MQKLLQTIKAIIKYLELFLLLMFFWLTIGYRTNIFLLAIGIFSSAALTFFIIQKSNFGFNDKKIFIFFFIKYCIFLLVNVFKSTIEIMKIVLNPNYNRVGTIQKLKFDQNLKKYQKIMIANFITMTPGTFFISIYGNTFLVHLMDKRKIHELRESCINIIEQYHD